MVNETNKVLKLELYRNLWLAAVCVFVNTLILIANLWTSVLVFLCVFFTVISGSYYEQLSTGSLVEIPYLGPDSPDRLAADPRVV
ncbi:uncharacterized protein LOC127874452 isoform X2 [Dreissena polymorpha]|uniref:uncharacterized protein LOC127874452 isoform X2 n=1 Tax=Dreissena polymorpha TaxID=45954 RepID=UPI002263C0DF|nr:uncharacterized protein LOC127874452 isoform X2 [Dreissena polymorpha]